MFKKLIIVITITTLFIACKKQEIETFIPINSSTLIEAYFDNQLETHETRPFNGAVYMQEANLPLYEKYFGKSNFETKTNLDSTAVFAIGSLSKQITATLALLAVEDKKIDLNEPITKYLSDLPKDFDKVTLHHILNHTSGITNHTKSLAFEPGKDFYYSNTAYNLIGDLITKVYDIPFEEKAKALFEKLEMKDTSSPMTYNGQNLVEGYNGNEKISLLKVDSLLKHLSSKKIGVPAGGFLSTVRDLAIWNKKLHEGQILKPETYQLMITPSSMRKHPIWGQVAYGYSLQIVEKNPKHYFHSGYIKGFPCINVYFPNTKTSLIVLENVSNDSRDFAHIFSHHRELRQFINHLQLGVEKSKINEELKKLEKK